MIRRAEVNSAMLASTLVGRYRARVLRWPVLSPANQPSCIPFTILFSAEPIEKCVDLLHFFSGETPAALSTDGIKYWFAHLFLSFPVKKS